MKNTNNFSNENEYITISKAAALLKLSIYTVTHYYNQGILKGLHLEKERFLMISKASINDFLIKNKVKQKKEEYLSIKEAAAFINVAIYTIINHCNQGILKGLHLKNKKSLMISRASIDDFLKIKQDYISIKEAALLMKLSITITKNYYLKGLLDGFQFNKHKPIMILKTSLNKLLITINEINEEYITTKEAAALMKLSVYTVTNYYYQGFLKGLNLKNKKSLMISKASINDFLTKKKEMKQNYITITKAACLFNASISTVTKYYHEGLLQGIQLKKGKHIKVLKTSVNRLLKIKKEKKSANSKSFSL